MLVDQDPCIDFGGGHAMKYSVVSHPNLEDDIVVTHCFFDGQTLIMDWSEKNKHPQKGHLQAEAKPDGTLARTYGYPTVVAYRTITFEVFRSVDGGVVLWGAWRNAGSRSSGEWVLRLTPTLDVS
jgi:hypothetical protein